jgi:hypothetical protein
MNGVTIKSWVFSEFRNSAIARFRQVLLDLPCRILLSGNQMTEEESHPDVHRQQSEVVKSSSDRRYSVLGNRQ